MNKPKTNGNGNTIHLKVTKATVELLRKLAAVERRTMHNLAVVVLEQGLQRRKEERWL